MDWWCPVIGMDLPWNCTWGFKKLLAAIFQDGGTKHTGSTIISTGFLTSRSWVFLQNTAPGSYQMPSLWSAAILKKWRQTAEAKNVVFRLNCKRCTSVKFQLIGSIPDGRQMIKNVLAAIFQDGGSWNQTGCSIATGFWCRQCFDYSTEHVQDSGRTSVPGFLVRYLYSLLGVAILCRAHRVKSLI